MSFYLVANNCINVPGYFYFYFRGSTLKFLQKIGFDKKKEKYMAWTTLSIGRLATLKELGTLWVYH
ncbi:hypothetical protein CJ263_17430 [Maribacter cobaltidurans]|uniref:Uncharacterized protein n=1 Tax=Maribacter cobaltidurans TaxID=1178778 RepID=A0A223V8X5_9FLAO|nr:hypothetical protein CJ263_17430 [Maribacter cobaltidurans]